MKHSAVHKTPVKHPEIPTLMSSSWNVDRRSTTSEYKACVVFFWSKIWIGSGLVSFFTSSGAQRVCDRSAQRHWRSSYFWGENLSPACWFPTLLTLHLWSRWWSNLKWCLFLTFKDINLQHLLHRCKATMCKGNIFFRRVFLNQYTRLREIYNK